MKHYVYTHTFLIKDIPHFFFYLKNSFLFQLFKIKVYVKDRKKLFANLEEIQEQANAGARTIYFILQL